MLCKAAWYFKRMKIDEGSTTCLFIYHELSRPVLARKDRLRRSHWPGSSRDGPIMRWMTAWIYAPIRS